MGDDYVAAAIICKSINLCWFFFKWVFTLGLLAALLATPLWYRHVFFRVEEEVRVRVEAHIAKRLPHLNVQVRSAHLASDGIEVRGLSISEPGAAGPQVELAYFDVVFLACATSPQDLLSGEPTITRVKVTRPTFRATRRPDNSFSLSKLIPLPEAKRPTPSVEIENGTIEIFDPLKNPSSMCMLREIGAKFEPAVAEDGETPVLKFEASLLGDQVHRIEISGEFDLEHRQWTTTGRVDGLELCPELRNSLPEQLAARLEPLAALRAPANLTFKLCSDPTQTMPRFEVTGSIARGRIDDLRLPYPLTDVRGNFFCDNSGFRLTDFVARDGPTQWEIQRFQQSGYAPSSPFLLRASGTRVHLDAKWASKLPHPFNRYWYEYDPAGDINLGCTLEFDGVNYKPTLEVRCLQNVSFSYFKFPYRLERGQGTLSLVNKQLTVAMTGFAGAQPVAIEGSFSNPGRDFTGWVTFNADKIPLDDKLFAAVVKDNARQTLISLNPRGTFNLHFQLWRDDPRIREMQQYAKVTLDRSNRCSLTYDKFPYPLSNVEGVVELKAGKWSFEKLSATNGPAIVNLKGQISTTPGPDAVNIAIDAHNVMLVDELRNAFQPGIRKLWDALQPHGKIDVYAGVTFDSIQRKSSVSLRAIPRDDGTSIGTSIEPTAFPYRLRLLDGYVDYRDGHAALHKIRAVHGTTNVETGGTCDIGADGSWKLSLQKLTVDRLRLHGEDHELVAALPEGLRHAVTELKPSGPINLEGNVEFARLRPEDPLHTGWDVSLLMSQGGLQVGPKLENIFGRVRLRGAASGGRFSGEGELAVDSLTYKNFQLTQIAGPLWYDNANVYLGAWGPAGLDKRPKPHVQAKVLGGTIGANGHVQLGAVPRYHVMAGLSQIDMNQFGRENLANGGKLNGKVAGNIELWGTRGPRNLTGTGNIQLTDADIYKLPVMVSMLKIARAKTPDATAFTQGDITFDIQQGENIILKKINLNGDAISLTGQGELKLDGQSNPVNLQLHTSVGRGNLPLLSEASRQILLIHVGGTLENPITQSEPFPVANQALQQLQATPAPAAEPGTAGTIMRTLGLSR